jgi:hypothetical protein
MATLAKLVKSDADHSPFQRRVCEGVLAHHLHTLMASKVYTDTREIHLYIFTTDLNTYTTATCIDSYMYLKAQGVSSRFPTAEARVRSWVDEVALWQFLSN